MGASGGSGVGKLSRHSIRIGTSQLRGGESQGAVLVLGVQLGCSVQAFGV